MTILAQHGWGKTNKVERGLADGSIQGVIMSPRDETPANLATFLSEIRDNEPSAERLADPLFHVGAIGQVRPGMLIRYPHYRSNLVPTSFNTSTIGDFVRRTLDWQYELDVSAVVSPTVIVDNFGTRWEQIAMMMAQETTNQHNDPRPLLISLVVEEAALRQPTYVDVWLDELTQLNVDGFYLVVLRQSSDYRQQYDQEVLASLLRVCYSLGELNQYRIYLGYTDMVTLLLHAVGVHGTGSGWSSTLKQFTLRRFLPSTWGSQPRPRYSSRPLLNSIFITELDGIYNGGGLTYVLSGTGYDTPFTGATNPENVLWPRDNAALHHWRVLADISQAPSGATIGDRLDSARDLVTQARSVYALTGAFVPFTAATGSTHLDQWLDALNRFRSDMGV